MNYEEKTESVEVPVGTGVDGFLLALRRILALGRVQDVHIDARGKVTYRRFVREDDTPHPLELNFDTLMPYALVRNGLVLEVLPSSSHAGTVLAQLFTRASADHVYPVAWIGGANTVVWRWFSQTLGYESPVDDELFGLPFHRDRMVDDQVLILCAAFGRHSDLADTRRSYKVLLPPVIP